MGPGREGCARDCEIGRRVIVTNPKKRVERMVDDQAMIDGIQKFLAQNATLTVGGKTMPIADIVKVFQDRIGTAKGVIDATAAKTAAVKVDRDERANTAKFVHTFIRLVQATFADAPDTLAVFHLEAPKTPKKTAKVKAEAAAKGVAKREAVKKAKETIDAPAATPTPAAPPKPTA
jgi:hypothetical protein